MGIDIKTLDDVGFQFFQTELIRKVLEATRMDYCNGLQTPTKVEALLGTDVNGYEDNRDWTNSYFSDIGIMLYLESNKRPDISFAIHQCDRFTNNTKESQETAVNRICWYIQGTKYNGLVFNPPKKLLVDCYANDGFS